jgi:NAD(P)H-hydrate epimerase
MPLHQFILRNKISSLLPRRKPDTNKGDYGRLLIVAGSPGMTGAAVLASRGAMRSGVGYAILAVPKSMVPLVDSMTPEVVTIPFEQIPKFKKKVNAFAIGPGIGINRKAKKLISSLVARPTTLVIDADGINNLGKNPKRLKKAKAKVILTPHPGEMARLTGKKIKDIQKNRQAITLETAKKLGCIIILKGHKTVIADPSGKLFVNPSGNPGMASAGVGDVLTGMIGSFAAQGLSPWDAAVAGVYLHGYAGDLAAKEKGEYGMIASDLVEKVPYAISKNT